MPFDIELLKKTHKYDVILNVYLNIYIDTQALYVNIIF